MLSKLPGNTLPVFCQLQWQKQSVAIWAIWLWWLCGLGFEPSLCLTGPYEARTCSRLKEQGSRPQHGQKDQGGPRGDCSHSCGLLSASQVLSGTWKEPLLYRHCYTVTGDMSHICYPLSSPSRASTHAHSEAHPHTPFKHLHKRFMCPLPHSSTYTLVFSCRHMHDILYPPTNPHNHTSMHTQAHCHLYTCAYVHGSTYAHFHTRTPVLTHQHTHAHLH